MIRPALALVACIALGACGEPYCPPPATQARVVTQKVLVAVPCVNAADIAPEPDHIATMLEGKKAGASLILVDRSALALRTWGEGLRAQLLACAKGAP